MASDFERVKTSIAEAITDNQSGVNLIAAFVRAAFHDCITATPDKPTSGCNGSLRLAEEINNANNARLAPAIAQVTDAVTGTCVSVADGIQLAMVVSLAMAGGPDVSAEVVDAANPRVDATIADTVDGQLPDRNSNFATLASFYASKGLSETDLVSSSAGAHSIGGFRGRGGVLPFTNDANTVSPGYSRNLISFSETGNHIDGFNTLRSDRALVTNADALDKLRMYSGCTVAAEGCDQNASNGLALLNAEFKDFLIKMSRMTGLTVGNSLVLEAGL